MALNIPQLVTELNKVAKTVFGVSKEKLSLPFIVYTRENNEDMHADNAIYHRSINVDIQVYTLGIEVSLHQQLENIFITHEIPFEATLLDEYVASEGFFMSTYSIEL